MKFKELVSIIAYEADLSQKQVTRVLQALAKELPEALNTGESVSIPGLGKFHRKYRNARVARNPQTGETVEISARNVAAFSPAKQLKEQVS